MAIFEIQIIWIFFRVVLEKTLESSASTVFKIGNFLTLTKQSSDKDKNVQNRLLPCLEKINISVAEVSGEKI